MSRVAIFWYANLNLDDVDNIDKNMATERGKGIETKALHYLAQGQQANSWLVHDSGNVDISRYNVCVFYMISKFLEWSANLGQWDKS